MHWAPSKIYTGWKPGSSSDELMHHGILGMQWGHRNGPPYPLNSGDHSAKEKKAGWRKSLGNGDVKSARKKQKEIYKAVKGAKGDIKSLKEIAKNNVSPEMAKEIKDKFNAWRKLSDVEEKFYSSKEYYDATAKAYDDTYKWFKENEPDYLRAIIKNNGGDKDTLDGFHDFRKVFEGTHDSYLTSAQEKYYKRKGVNSKSLAAAEQKAWKEYQGAKSAVAKQLSGKYGRKKVRWDSTMPTKLRLEEALGYSL